MERQTGFLDISRKEMVKIPVGERLSHYSEIHLRMAEEELRRQALRCMECGVPFCHGFGCPLGNMIPEWNEMIAQGRWREALHLLQATNNFPEITGRICPAMCESACTLAFEDEAVTVRQNELVVIERGFREGWIVPEPPTIQSGKRVAVIGSGPAGMAAAQQLRRAGHGVVVFEKADRPGGILRYGIPDFKIEKWVLDRRFDIMAKEGVVFELSVDVGRDLSMNYLRRRFDAICLAIGAGQARDLPVPGRDLKGIYQAMTFLTQQNRRVADLPVEDEEIQARDKRVVIIGGGDTGSDCLGTALRQNARSVHQLEILPKPPEGANPTTPWPQYPNILRTSSSHEEGGERRWCVCTKEFKGSDGRLCGLKGIEVEWSGPDESGRMLMKEKPGSEFEMEADLVILSMGFVQPEHEGLLDDLKVAYQPRGSIQIGPDQKTSVPDVFAAGDATTGPWLVSHAIAGGRRMACAVDLRLMGKSSLPEPPPTPMR